MFHVSADDVVFQIDPYLDVRTVRLISNVMVFRAYSKLHMQFSPYPLYNIFLPDNHRVKKIETNDKKSSPWPMENKA